MSTTRLAALIMLLTLGLVTPALAQDPHVTVGAVAGWTFSDGVSSDHTVLAPDGNLYNRIDPKDSFAFDLNVGYLASEGAEIGFIYGVQPTKLTVSGTNTKELGDITVSTYHGYFGYNFLDSDSKVRPYAFFGLGATNYGSVGVNLNGENHTLGGATQFSTTWGAGVKVYPSPKVGFQGGIRWTPTYIKSDPGGYWCDPWYGCYMVGNAQYSNQWNLNGGLSLRF